MERGAVEPHEAKEGENSSSIEHHKKLQDREIRCDAMRESYLYMTEEKREREEKVGARSPGRIASFRRIPYHNKINELGS